MPVTSPNLVAATVSRRDSQVTLTWTVIGDMPTRGTWLLSMTVAGGEHGPIHHFGIKALDGDLVAVFIFDHVKTVQHNFTDVRPARTGDKWTAVFSVAGMEVAEAGEWSATLNVDGHDIHSVDGTF